MRRSLRRRLAIAAILLVAVVTGCGAGEEGEGGAAAPASPTSEPTSTAAGTPAVSGTQVTATMTEFEIDLSVGELSPGTYTFLADNSRAQAPHALAIEGPGVSGAKTSVLRPGETEPLTVNLQQGTYKIWCPVGNHEAQGMVLTVNVS
jgi:uncharacterized cupredoxin-like copper-binding protein